MSGLWQSGLRVSWYWRASLSPLTGAGHCFHRWNHYGKGPHVPSGCQALCLIFRKPAVYIHAVKNFLISHRNAHLGKSTCEKKKRNRAGHEYASQLFVHQAEPV